MTEWAASRSPFRRALDRGRGAWRFRRQQRFERRLAGPKLLRAFADAYAEPFFIEIGANDGTQGDPLHPLILSRGWRGIMVEPHPEAFARLRQNYGGVDGIALENVAISDTDGRRPFYEIRPPDRPEEWEFFGSYDQLGSLSREAIATHEWVADLDRRVVETEVECLRFETLCRRHGVERLDLLLIDTEGYDLEVLRQVDLSRLRPRLVIYEHTHLDSNGRSEALGRVVAAGYETLAEHFDTWCLDTSIDDALTRRWRELEPGAPPVYSPRG
jgi:FkbM family methyltransferase